MSEPLLENRDYTVIVAKTAPSVTLTPPGFDDRWKSAHTAILALAKACEEHDPDGITIYMSSSDSASGAFRQYRQVTPDKLETIFDENYPPQTLNLLEGLHTALDDYFARRLAGQAKPNGATIIVLIDGEPQDRMAIAKTLVEATENMTHPQELGIGFAQVGDDIIARGFLTALDHDLRSTAGAKFDIVKTRVLDEIGPNCLTEFLMDVIHN